MTGSPPGFKAKGNVLIRRLRAPTVVALWGWPGQSWEAGKQARTAPGSEKVGLQGIGLEKSPAEGSSQVLCLILHVIEILCVTEIEISLGQTIELLILIWKRLHQPFPPPSPLHPWDGKLPFHQCPHWQQGGATDLQKDSGKAPREVEASRPSSLEACLLPTALGQTSAPAQPAARPPCVLGRSPPRLTSAHPTLQSSCAGLPAPTPLTQLGVVTASSQMFTEGLPRHFLSSGNTDS